MSKKNDAREPDSLANYRNREAAPSWKLIILAQSPIQNSLNDIMALPGGV